MTQTIDGIRYEVVDHVATITLDRPERRNAFTLTMIDQWVRKLGEADADPSVRVVVITGAGTSFCAGADLGEIFAQDPTPMGRKDRLAQHIQQVGLQVSRMDKPLIAAVNGPAVGAGMDMALMCDFRIASERARLSAAYVKVGVMPGNGAAYYLPRIVGQSRALELLLTGRTVDAPECLELGLVATVVAPEDLMPEVQKVAATIASYPPVLVQMIKRTVRHSVSGTFEASLDLVSSAAALVHSSRSALGD
jgi:enoyl-CoA hydratase/carnithine racemase